MSAVAVPESSLCAGPRLGGSLVTPVCCFYVTAVRIFKPRDPTLLLYHPAGRMGQTGTPGGAPGWDPGQRLVSWHLTLLRPLQLQRVAGGPHFLHCPGGSRVRHSPTQAPGSPEDLTQHLEKGPSLRAGGEGREGGRAHYPGEGNWREGKLQSHWIRMARG